MRCSLVAGAARQEFADTQYEHSNDAFAAVFQSISDPAINRLRASEGSLDNAGHPRELAYRAPVPRCDGRPRDAVQEVG